MNSKITGVGSYFPKTVVTNADLVERFGIDPWLLKELGIEKRFWASRMTDYSLCENQGQMMAKAIKEALEDAKLEVEQVELLITSSTIPDYSLPTTATLVQEELGVSECNAIEIHCGCVGALQAIDIANCYIKCGKVKNVVIATSNLMSTYWLREWKNGEISGTKDQLNMAMFSDSASAIVIEDSEENGIIYSFAKSIGTGIEKGIYLDAGGAVYPGDIEVINKERHKWKQNPKLIKKYGSMLSQKAIEELFRNTQLQVADLKCVIFPQANPSLLLKDIDSLRNQGFPVDIIKFNVNRMGNSATASLFHVLHEIIKSGEVHYGDKIAIIGGEASKWMYGGVLIEWKK